MGFGWVAAGLWPPSHADGIRPRTEWERSLWGSVQATEAAPILPAPVLRNKLRGSRQIGDNLVVDGRSAFQPQ